MRIIRLTALTMGGLTAAMMYFGRDEGLGADRIGREPEPVVATVLPDPTPAAEPVEQIAAEPSSRRIPPARVLTRLSVMEPLPGSAEAFPLTARP
ncbi:hypothetical protein [Aliiroseovarius sp.]|uniref:hypothetical protein n=1 Tax=Aliiroseovarius sp. TaxID=1872442 RepID=UPI003BAD488D